MTEELKPVRCGCGGEAMTHYQSQLYGVRCEECFIGNGGYNTEAEAITAWNRAMSGVAETPTTKVLTHEVTLNVDGRPIHTTEFLCGACKKKVLGGDAYCSHCGARLDWSGNE